MAQVNQFTEQATEMTALDRFGFDQQDPSTLEWQTKKYDLPTLMGALQELFPDLFKTIYNSDGTITPVVGVDNRTVNMNGLKLTFVNGRFLVGTTGLPSTAFQMEVQGSGSGLRVSGVSGSGAEFHGAIAGAQFFSPSGLGVFSSANRNVFRSDSTAIPSSVPSSMFEIMSEDQGVRLFPQMSESSRVAISSPADGLMLHNMDIGYPEMKHSVYGWQPIGYGNIRLSIDFSITPLNSGNGWKISIPTLVPIDILSHKIIILGSSVPDPVGDSFVFGFDSQTDYCSADASSINGNTGFTYSVNSKRTVSLNENFNIEYAGASGVIGSGRMNILIMHT